MNATFGFVNYDCKAPTHFTEDEERLSYDQVEKRVVIEVIVLRRLQ